MSLATLKKMFIAENPAADLVVLKKAGDKLNRDARNVQGSIAGKIAELGMENCLSELSWYYSDTLAHADGRNTLNREAANSRRISVRRIGGRR